MPKIAYHKIGNLLLRPFRENFLFFMALFILATCPFIIKASISHLINGALLAAHCLVVTYLVTLAIGFIQPKFLRKLIQGLIIGLSLVDFGINLYCVIRLGYFFDADVVRLVLGTNSIEAREFLTSMIPLWIVLVVAGVYLFFFALWQYSLHHNINLGKKASITALEIVVLCAAVNTYSWRIWGEGPIHRLVELCNYSVPESLKSHYCHPDIALQDNNQLPSHVVLIIGESFARFHSSLYGYEKKTNPLLEAKRDSSTLFALDSIDSPAPTTIESLKHMLTIYSKADDNNPNAKKWFDRPSIIEIMQECGYLTYWFSNNAKGSRYTGIATMFADACHQRWFLQQEGALRYNVHKDMILVDSSSQHIRQLDPLQHHFIVYHMMGSHYNYNQRYSDEFAQFTEQDYMDQPQDHRTTLATYDNSILYNDYVVEQIINLFKDTETILIYVPDHGQVMYRNPNNPDYFAHGNNQDPMSYAYGVEIPFIIYASPLFQQKHPDTVERIKYRQNHPKAWNSDDLPYLIMDLIGVKTIEGKDIKEKSILN